MKDWFLDRIRTQAVGAGAKEIEKFIAGLEAMEDEDIGTMIAIATVIRVNFETHGVIAEGVFTDDPLPSAEVLGRYQLEINRLSRQFRKMGLAVDSAAAMVWSYTLRCLNVLELRPLGNRMWLELGRGFPHVEDALKKGEAEKREVFADRVWSEWGLTPTGFASGQRPEIREQPLHRANFGR